MTVLTNSNGHPTSGTTTERTLARYAWEPGEVFYDTTLGQQLVYNGTAWLPVDGTYMPVATAAGTGTVIGNAAAVTYGFTSLTGADNAVGVQLPTPVAGRVVVLKNLSTTAAVKVYPATNTQINALGTNNAQTLSANTACSYVAYNTAVVYTVPHAAS